VVSATDISDAYEYHVMLQTLADNPDYGESDDAEEYDSEEEDDDDDDDDEDDDNDEEEQKKDEARDDEANAEELTEVTQTADDNDSPKQEEEGEEEEPPKFPLFLLTSKTELTLPALGRNTPNWKDCPNSKVRSDMWLNVPDLDLGERGLGFLDQIGQLCIQAKIHECTKKKCVETRNRMEYAAPDCDWDPFRRWALVAMSCQACLSSQQKLTRAHTHIASAVYGCCMILQDCKSSNSFRPFFDGPSPTDGSEPTRVNLAAVCNVISWMMLIEDETVIRPKDLDDWDRKFLPSTVTLPVIEEAAKGIQDLGICRNRLWNLVGLSERQDSDLPHFIKAITSHKKSFQAFHGNHDFCTPTKCQRAQIDSTTVAQMHKCYVPDACEQRTFNVDLLETSLEIGKGTAWSTIGPYLSRPNESYIAISHVWSDGTGVGVKNAGCVNKCLFDFFAEVAKALNCTGIWWDALSIPQESKARSKALNRMHANYANAATTVVHDNYLINFEWRDDGSPCLALVLSTWFTRGWTALELIMSKRVKVLFKDPKGGTMPLIKDLDKDVLAQDPGATSRAHWLVSGFIRRLRKPIGELSDLLAILKARSTSWARDRTIIAALLLNIPDCDFTRVEGEITRDILKHLGYIPFECLFHGGVTMADSGPWSWCPATLDDMRMDLSKKMRGLINKDYDLMIIDKKGGVTGEWGYRQLTRQDIPKLMPVGENLAVRVKIKTVLRHWKKCLLLREWDDVPEPLLLVTTVGVTRSGLLECRYIGTVTEKRSKDGEADNPAEDDSDNNSDTSERSNGDNGGKDEDSDGHENDNDDGDGDDIDGEVDTDDLWDRGNVRIGNDEGKKEIRARLALMRMWKALTPEKNPNNLNDNSDGENSDSESLYEPETLSDYEPSSDEESPRTVADFFHLKDVSEKTPSNPPWFMRWSATEYRRFDNDMISGYEVDSFDSDEEKVEHLFAAVKANKKNVIRHLLKSGTDFLAERKPNLGGELDPAKESTFKKLKTLGEVYLEIGQLEDAQLMHNLVIHGLRSMKKRGATETLEAMHTLGKICVRQRNSEEARRAFQQVYKICKEKDKKREQRKNAKALKAQAASKDPSSKTHTAGRRPSRVAPASKMPLPPKGNPTPQANPSSKENKSNEPKNDQKATKWHKVKFSTIADLCLLYADDNNPTEAAKVYQRALKEYGKAPIHVNAFESSWGSGEDDLKSELRKKLYEEAEETYVYALKRLEGEKHVGKEHILTLITVLNLAIVNEFFKKYQEAEVLYERARAGFEAALGPDHIMTLSSIRRLAIVFTFLEKLHSAGPLYQTALNGVEKRYGPYDKYTLTVISDFGNYYLDQKNSFDAERKFQHVLDGYERGYHQHQELYLVALRDTARSCILQDRLQEAEEKFGRALDGLNEIPGQALAACSTAFSLGVLYEELGRLPDAENWFRYCLKGYQEFDEREALKAAGKLGLVQEARGNITDAEAMLRRAYEGYSRTLGKFHTPTLEAAKNLGSVCIRVRKLDEAETLCTLALTGLVKALGPDDSVTLEASRSLGKLYFEQLKLDLSKKYFTDTLKGFEKTLGMNHELTLRSVTELGNTCACMGHYEEAEGLYQQAIDGFDWFPRAKGASKVAVQKELAMLTAALKLGDLYSEQDVVDLARQNIQQALDGFNNILGSEDPNTLEAVLSLGKLNDQSPAEAEKLIQCALDGFDKTIGPDDIRTLDASATLGYRYMDDPAKLSQASNLIKRAMDGYVRQLVPDHPLTLEAMHRLGVVYMELGWAPEGGQLLKDAMKGFERRLGPDHALALKTILRLRFPTIRTSGPDVHTLPQAQTPRVTPKSVLGPPPSTSLGRKKLPIHPKPRPTIPEKDSGFDESYTLPSESLPGLYTPSIDTPPVLSNRNRNSDKASMSYPSKDTSRSPLPKQTKPRNVQASPSLNRENSDNIATPYGSRPYTATPPLPDSFLEELQSHQSVLDQNIHAGTTKGEPVPVIKYSKANLMQQCHNGIPVMEFVVDVVKSSVALGRLTTM
jgi:tetratricopeptide (TPR) repeat protein